MKTTLLVTLALLLTQAAFAAGLPSEMSGTVYGFLSSAKRFTYDYSSHPTVKEIGTIVDGSLILDSKVFSDFTVTENKRLSVFRSRGDGCLVEVQVPNPLTSVYMIRVKHDDGRFEGYTIKHKKTEPNKTLQRMPMSVTPDASASAAPATGIPDL